MPKRKNVVMEVPAELEKTVRRILELTERNERMARGEDRRRLAARGCGGDGVSAAERAGQRGREVGQEVGPRAVLGEQLQAGGDRRRQPVRDSAQRDRRRPHRGVRHETGSREKAPAHQRRSGDNIAVGTC